MLVIQADASFWDSLVFNGIDDVDAEAVTAAFGTVDVTARGRAARAAPADCGPGGPVSAACFDGLARACERNGAPVTRTTPPRPLDLTAVFPELATMSRKVTRLHPRSGLPTVEDSSVGGPLLWPQRAVADVHTVARGVRGGGVGGGARLASACGRPLVTAGR